ncbi:hypothetical protein RCG23_17040 [Neobacillus sp. PS3-34]|uniref:hypothetical protein n=1 Tax=Neobacillus sp. PS3-34 TaxID=3070678 RepID=UPI0027E20EE5|nr:hypothetical protein [Neobacillus sp. PS3-34]WML47224.1 hypothetical protein RCG23_17040 [Neobacillus sp. PS3-34]
MAEKEEEYLLNEERKALFGPPDGKILALDPFRGPYTGITSAFDLENTGKNLKEKEENF